MLTLAGRPVPRRGRDLGDLGIVPGGSVLAVRGTIAALGRARDLQGEARRLGAGIIDCRGRVLMPGFVDSHTHLVFAGSRVEDYERRIGGATYEEIARAGGGIRYTARLVAEASQPALVAQARQFLDDFAACGSTTVEVKTGYGLEVESEIKMLRVIRALGRGSAEPVKVGIVPTLLAAHALPAAYQDRREEYLEAVISRLIPFAAQHRLAEFIDCFCDRGSFKVDECRRVLTAGVARGLIPRLHAEQLARTGGARLGIEINAASVDHLDHLSAADVRELARSDTVATLLPGANLHLGLKDYAPARRLVDAGAAIALATDFNPGTSPTLNMQFILSLGCAAMHLSPAEAISAATINPAYSLRRADQIGSIEPGKHADLVVMDVDDYRKIPYYFAWNHCGLTVKQGRIVYARAAQDWQALGQV
ncbi:MAG TPA: imidazolonepropionase [Terriglobia bacterium]|nr:imidazolonepropionase [Terriglobia bacterium]